MAKYATYEIIDCISELESIVNQLYAVSDDIEKSVKGMNTYKYRRALEKSAEKYKRAANKLKKIK